ncbi:MAG: UvrD-helicase domain-containing protein [Planctomycetota bacterium]|nr:UvrD-helicase domain-containing protein [Planctomycetota bacterium]
MSPTNYQGTGLADEQVRELAINELSHHIFLSAGAGTGKTHVLVHRYLSFLSTGAATVPEIVCVTFTEKAAGELKARIRAECERAAMQSPDSESKWIHHKRALENAPINTIHGFCARLLRENAFALGIDPRFQVLDERGSERRRQEIAREHVLGRLRRMESNALALLAEYLGIPEVISICEGLLFCSFPELTNGRSTEELLKAWEEFRLGSLTKELQHLARMPNWTQAVAALETNEPIGAGCKVALRRVQILAGIKELMNESLPPVERLQAGQAILGHCSLQHMSGRKWQNPDLVKESIVSLRDMLRPTAALQAASAQVEQSAAELSNALTSEWPILARSYRQAKFAASALDFDDLQWQALHLLRNQPAVCLHYRQRFKAFLIDEFQDTDQVQKEILWRLSGLHSESVGTASNVFIVGDAKQSIYRFRGADVSVFNETELEMQERSRTHVLQLSRNFRTIHPLMEFVNDVFSEEDVMGIQDKLDLFEAKYNRLSAHRKSEKIECADLVITSGKEGEPLEQLRLRQAEAVAWKLRYLIDKQPFQIEEADSARPIQWKDISVLLRAMTDVAGFERAFRQWGIPYYLVAGRGLYGRQEVKDLLSFLRAIENSQNEVALASVLRSPFVGINDETLFWLCNEGNLTASLAVIGGRLTRKIDSRGMAEIASEEVKKLKSADATLRRYRRIKDRLPLGQLIDSIVNETGFSSALLAGPGGEQKVSNVRKIADLARSTEGGGTLALDDFIQVIADLTVREAREGEASTNEEESNVVKILTIHKSKGLEWPIVVVPDLERRPVAYSGKFIMSPQFGPIVRGEEDNGERVWSSVGQILKSQDNEKDTAERRRLLYVAMTRARDHLVLCGVLQSQEAPENTWLSWLLSAYPKVANVQEDGFESLNQSWRLGRTISAEESNPPPVQEARVGADTGNESFDPRSLEVIDPDTAGRLRFTVTELEEYDACPHKFYLKRVKDIAEYHPTGATLPKELSAADRGTLAHSAMQKLLTTRGRNIDELVKVALREAGYGLDDLPEAYSSITSMLERFRDSELWPQFQAAEELYIEAPFSFGLPSADRQIDGASVVEGTVDALLIDSNGRTKLVDFKTGQARSEPYEFQLGIYSLAIKAWRGMLPEAVYLYFMDSGKHVELQVEQLADASEARLIEVIAGIANTKFERWKDANCGSCGVYWTCSQRTESVPTLGL